jgi:hypothetical protein
MLHKIEPMNCKATSRTVDEGFRLLAHRRKCRDHRLVRLDELLLIHITAVVEIAPLRFVLVGGEQQLQQTGKRGAPTLPAGRDRLGSLAVIVLHAQSSISLHVVKAEELLIAPNQNGIDGNVRRWGKYATGIAANRCDGQLRASRCWQSQGLSKEALEALLLHSREERAQAVLRKAAQALRAALGLSGR